MNSVFKSIWHHTSQTWIAVSELTSAKGKTKSLKLSVAAALVGVSTGVFAEGLPAESKTGPELGKEYVVVGKNAKASENQSVAVGNKAEAAGDVSVAVGSEAKAPG